MVAKLARSRIVFIVFDLSVPIVYKNTGARRLYFRRFPLTPAKWEMPWPSNFANGISLILWERRTPNRNLYDVRGRRSRTPVDTQITGRDTIWDTCMQTPRPTRTASLKLLLYLGIAVSLQAASAGLMDAVANEDVSAARTLLQNRADVDATAVDGTTPLHWAVHTENTELVDLLIGAKANVRAADRYGVTPLYLACSLANIGIADRLLKAGADPNALDQSGETLLSVATRAGSPELVTALLKHGAKVDAPD